MERAPQVDDALTQALAAWERGEDWEKLMADAPPAVKEGLRRDMAAVLALRQALPEPDPRAESRSRAAWMAAGAEQRVRRQKPAASDGPPRRWWAGGVLHRPRLAWLAAGLAAWLALGGGAVWAAEGSLPGDGLYPIKTWRYEVLVALARSPASRLKAMQVQEDSYRRDCLAVLALGREVEVEFFGRLEAIDGSTWRIGGLPVDVSGADLSAVLVSARPLEGRRLVVDARTEKGRVIGLRVSPAPPLPGDAGEEGSSDTAKGGPADEATASATAPATAPATGPAPVGTEDAAAETTGAPGGAAGSRAGTRRSEDAVFATLRYPNDVLVNVHASWLNPRKNRDVTVVGDRRMLTFDDMNMGEPIRIYDKQVTDDRVKPAFLDTFASFRAQVRDGDVLIPKVALGEPLKAECDHFLDCIKNGKEPITSAKQATDVVRVLEAMERSAKNAGREEKV